MITSKLQKLFSVSLLSVFCGSCSEVGQILDQSVSDALGVQKGSFYKPSATGAISTPDRPTVLRLIGAEYGSTMAYLRWSGSKPSLKMESGNWVVGNEVEHRVFQFSEDKYYSLTIHFPHEAFIEGGFDGTWLPTLTGSYKIVK